MQEEYKTRNDWAGKVIHWEVCKKLKLDHNTKWYFNKQKSILKNETHKILWDFEIQTSYLIPSRRPDLRIVNKRLAIEWKKKKEKRENYLNLARELKRWCLWNAPQQLLKRARRIRYRRTNRNHPNYSIFKIGQNTEKNPRNLR